VGYDFVDKENNRFIETSGAYPLTGTWDWFVSKKINYQQNRLII
jgi:hypothetical protein